MLVLSAYKKKKSIPSYMSLMSSLEDHGWPVQPLLLLDSPSLWRVVKCKHSANTPLKAVCYLTFSWSLWKPRAGAPGSWEGVGTSGCDQGKWTLGVALPEDLKHHTGHGFHALLVQAGLSRENIITDSPHARTLFLIMKCTQPKWTVDSFTVQCLVVWAFQWRIISNQNLPFYFCVAAQMALGWI